MTAAAIEMKILRLGDFFFMVLFSEAGTLNDCKSPQFSSKIKMSACCDNKFARKAAKPAKVIF
jgi:hypothetical protein